MSVKKQNRVLELIRSMPSLREIFFLGRLARWFRLLADWRKQGRLRRELLARRRERPIMETLEPRVMLSADAYSAVGAGAHDLAVKIVDVDGTTPTLQVLDNGTVKISHVLSSADPYELSINGSTGADTLKIDLGFDRATTAAEQAALSIKFTGGDGDDKVAVGSASATTYTANSLSVISDEAMSVTGNVTTANNLHLEVNTTSDGGILGSNINATSHAQLLATDAVLNAGGNIDLIAHSTLTVDTSGVGDFGLQLAVVKGSSVAELVVDGKSTLDAGGNLTLSAISDVSVNDVAKASPQSSASGGASSNRLDAAVAMSIIDSSATSNVIGQTSLDASSGVVGIHAANTVHVTTLADGTANDNHNIGGTLALSVVHTDTDASLNGSVHVMAQDVHVDSTSSNDVTTTAKSTAGGAQQGNGRIPNPSEQQLATYGAATSDGKVTFAGAVAISDLDADSQAFISGGSTISSSSNVGVLVNYIDHSTTLADASNTGSAAVGTPAGGATGVGVAVAIDLGHLGDSAYIGDADITAKAVTVQSLELKPSAFSAQAISGVGAGNTGVAGSLAINIVTTHTDAFIQQGASLQLHGAALTLGTTASITDTAFAHPGSGGATGADLGLGASVAINVTDNQSSAQIFGKVEGAGDTVITASGDFLTATIAQGGAAASGGTAITPVAALTISNSNTTAGVGELQGDVLTLGSLQVSATQTDRVGTLADATAAGADAAIGAALALSFVQDNATATTARDIVATGKAAFAATNSSLTINRAVASANGAKGESSGGGNADVNKQVANQRTLGDAFAASHGAEGSGAGSTPSASTSEGNISVAAAIGINVVDSVSDADVADGVSIKAGGAFSLEADNNTDAQANADASAASNAKGIGAAVAINVGSNAAHAAIGEGANVAAQGVSIQAKMATPPDSADTVNTMGATALAGAGGRDIGVAGSVAINIETSHVEAVIGQSASIDAGTGTVVLVAQNNTANTVSAKPKAGGASGADAGIGASLALDVADNLTRAEIEDGATVVATGPNSGLAIGAISAHSAQVTAEAGAASSNGVAVAPAVALAIENNDTHVRLGTSPTATAIGGPVVALASHSSNVSTTAGGTAAGQDAAVGASLALTIAGDQTTATIDRDVTAAGLVSVQALANATSNATATASASGAKGAGSGGAGDDPNAQADRQRNFGNSTATANGAKGASGSSANPKAETSDGSVSVAAAVAINIADSEARALIGDGHVVTSGANVGLKATNNTDAHANADGSAVQGTDSPRVKAGIGAAVALNLGNNTAQTRVGANSKIVSQGATFEASMTTVAGKDIVNSMGANATAGGAGKDVGIAGAVAINVENSTARTEIAAGASVDAGAGKIGFIATNNTDNSVGAHPKAGGATGGDAGIGASLALDLANNSTGVDIDAGASLVAAGDLTIAVSSAHRANVSAEAGAASTGGVAVAPAVAIAIENNDTHIGLHGGAAVAVGAIDATAKHTSAVVTTAGGTAAGSDAAIGASLALTIANDNTHVDIDGNVAATGNVGFQALANAASNANASASANGAPGSGGSSASGTPDAQSAKQRGFGDHVASEHGTGNSGGTATPKAQTSSGSVTVAAAVGINIATSQARVNLQDNRSIAAGGSVLLKATNNTDAHANADGSAVNGKVGVGVAVALNFGDNVAQARIGENASIAGKGVSLQALMTTIPVAGSGGDSTNSMGATAVAGAGGKDIGVAGAVAINVENSTVEAVVAAGGKADGGTGTVDLQAQNTTANEVSARPKAGGATGGDAGIGASLALDIANNLTRAEVEDTGLVTTTGAAGDVSMKATSQHTAKVTAEAGAASSGGVAVAPAVALAIENNDTHVRIGAAAAAMSIGGSLRGVADHRSSVETNAGGTAAGKDAAIGASLALTLANDDTHANVDGDVTTGKDIDFQALAASNSNANATASASGAHGSGSGGAGDDPNAQAKQQRDFGNTAAASSGVKGSGSSSANPQAATSSGDVTVAAAVAINVADSKASASVGNGKHLIAGGSVGLTATNNTDAHAGASGGAVEADVGIGAAVALNLGNNLAQARVGDNATIQSKGVNLTAGVTSLEGGKDIVNSMGATAVAGAGGKDVGIAGAVAINFESSTAEAVVAAGANVDGGTGAIVMQAQNTTANEVSARPLAGGATGSDAGIGASLALDIANNLTRAEVVDTGVVTTTGAAGDVTMKATSQHTAKVTAEAGAASSGGVAVAPAVALAIENNDTHVRLGAAAAPMSIGGSLRGVADHRSTVETNAGGTAAGKDAAIGASLALTLANDDTQANVDGDVIAGKDIDFQALAAADSKANATASASGAHGSGSVGAGDDPNAQAKQQRDFGNSAAASGGVKGSGSSSANPRAETSGGDVTVAAAVAINIADSKASANVGDGKHLIADGSVGLTATNNTDAHANASGSAVQGAAAGQQANVGIGAAVALNVGNNLAQARVGENATIQSQGANIVAGVTSLDTGKDTVNSMGATALAGAGGKDVGIAGAVAINIESSTGEALIADGANVDGGAGTVALSATNNTLNVVSARPIAAGASGGDAGIGVSVALDLANNLTRAELLGSGTLTTTGDATMNATSSHLVAVVAEAGAASSGGVGVAPAVAMALENNTTLVALDAGASLTIGGSITATATHTSLEGSIAGGTAAGSDAAVGASLALTIANDSTKAVIDRDVTAGGSVNFNALASATSVANATASASGAHPSGSGSGGDDPNAQAQTQRNFGDHVASERGAGNSGSTTNPKAETSDGAVTVAAAVAINIANSSSRALLADGNSVTAGGSLGLKATNNTDAHASADGSAVQGKVGIGAAVALNLGNNSAQARIGENTQVQSVGVNLNATMTPLSTGTDTVSSMGATAVAGGAGKDVGIAGAVAINIENSKAEALVATGAVVDGTTGNVTMVAQNNTANVVSARPKAGGATGGDAGIGASLALDLANNLTHAEIQDGATVTTTGSGNLLMGAASDHSANVTAEAGAASTGGVAVAPAVALAIENNDTQVRLGTSASATNVGGNLIGIAAHKSNVQTNAGGTAAGKDAAIGASLALTIANDKTIATTDRDIVATGNVTLQALAAAASQANATASAVGAKGTDEGGGSNTPNQQADKQRGFGDSVASEHGTGNSGSTAAPKAETSDGAVTVAAAVAIDIANSEARATLPDHRIITATGSVTLKATNNTDAHSNADGSAVAGSKDPQADVGIGAAVALTLGNNTAQARVGQDAIIASHGASFEASMTALPQDSVNSMGASATAGGGGKDVGIAGAVAINIENSKAEAVVATGANVNAGGGDVAFIATNNTANVTSAHPKAGGAAGGDAGIGASLALDLATNLTRTEIENDGIVTTTGKLSTDASSAHTATVSAEAGAASSGGVAVAPAVAIAIENNDTHSRFGSGLLMNVGSVDAKAEHSSRVSTNAGGTAVGKDAAIGASLALTYANDTTIATTDRDITASGDVSIQALASAASRADASASASGAAGESSGGSSTPDAQATKQRGFGDQVAGEQGVGGSGSTSNPKAETSDGSVTVAAAVGINIANSQARATLPDTRVVHAGGSFTLKATNNTDAHASADGSAVLGSDNPDAQVGIGAAVALNLGNNVSQARVGENAVVTSQGASIQALTTVVPGRLDDSTSSMGAIAKSGGGGKDVGIAGSVAINIENSTAEAVIAKGANVDAGSGAVIMLAQNNTANVTSATPLAGGATGGDAGIGASVALDLANNHTRAEVEDTAVLKTTGATGNIGLGAVSNHTAVVTAEAGATSDSGVAVAPSVAIALENSDTHARLGTGATMSVGGTLLAVASHQANVATNSGGTAAGSDAAIGAALALTIANDNTVATTDRDITAGGAVGFQALAAAASQANAKASASGAKGAGSSTRTPNEESDKQRGFGDQVAGEQGVGDSGSGSTPDAETSDGPVTVAAAVGINLAHSEAHATMPDGRTIIAGGNFGLKATNNTDATASADGSAVSDGDVGIGAALALNDGHNTAEARVGQGATVTAQGVSVQALMTSLEGGKDEVSTMGARAQAGAGGKDVGVAGAVALDFETSNAEAVIEAGGTQITTAGGDIIVSAQNTTGSSSIALGGTPGAGGANGGDVGVGAAFAMSIANNTSSAIVTDGVGMHGTSGNILITAGSADAIYTQAEAGASGGVGVAAAVALSVHTDDTTARLGTGGGVTATGSLGILAGHSNHLTTIAHGDGAGSDVGIGAAIGITIGGDTTIASLGRNVNAGGAAVIGGSSTTTAYTESKAGENGAAQSSGNSDDQASKQASFGDSKAGSNYSASEPKAQDSMDSASSETSSQDSGGVADLGIAAALSLSWTTDDVEALIDPGVVLVAGGAVTVGTVNSSDSAALALGTAILNETSIGAAVAINGLQITNHAIVGNNASVTGAGVSIFANEANDQTNDFQARALSAAGGTDNGIAGSVSINLITNDTLARVGTSAHITSSAGLAVAASESATLQNIAGSGAIGEDAGIGAAVAINLITNHTGAEIANNAVTDATGATSITAHGALTPRVDADLPFNPSGLAVAGSGAIDVAVSGSVMVDIINRDTHATIGDNTRINQSATGSAAQGLSVQASDSVKLWSGAGAVAAGISDAGVGASVHVGILNMDTRATVGNNARVKAQGQLAMSANASEDLTSIAVGLGVSTEAGIAGSFSINLVTDHTTAGFGDGSVFVGGATTARENNFITASDSTSLDSVAGAVAIGGEAGVGAGLSVGIINKTTHAGFGVGDSIDMTTGALAVSANSFESITAISANGGVGGEAGVAGSVDVYLVNTETIASLGHNSTLLGSNRVGFSANESSDVDLAAGTIAGGGSAGVGASNTTLVRNDVTRAFVGDHSTINNGGIGLSAHSSDTVAAIAAGGALGGSAGVAGSAVVNVINQTTEAFFDRNVTVTTTGAGNVGANASADTSVTGFGGALAAGGSAGIGAGVDVGVLSKVTQAYIAPGANVNASGTVSVTARSTEDILSISAALGAGGSAAVMGSASVYPVNVATRAFITGENADPRKGTPANPTVVHAHGDVVISASDMSHYDIISGNIGVGGSASIGAGAAVTVINKETTAYVGTNATVSGDGVGAGTLADTGAVGIAAAADSAPAGAVKGMITDAAILARGLIGDHMVTPTQATVHGVAITATNSDELLSLAVSGGLAGSVAVNVGAGVSVMNANTSAFVADNSKVNTAAGAGADQSVLIAAGNHYQHTGIVGVASLAITASIGPAADVNVVNTNTIASIGNGAQVKAARDVAVVAKADEDITSIAVAGAISAGVSVAGAVPVTVLNANTSATIGNNAKVDAGGNVLVKASDDTDLTMVGGSAGIGLYVGVGAAVDVDIITKHTDAHIGTGATVNAKGNSGDMNVLNGNLAGEGFANGAARGLVVQATSSEDIFTLGATGAGGIVGVAGGVTVSIIKSDTTAYIGTNAKINADQTGASGLQSVEVAAANSVTVSDFAGGVAGGLVGAAGGVDIGSVNNNTSAYVAGGAQVNARRDVNAYALSEQDISSLAASGAGGFVGLAGSVSVWTIGSSLQTGYSDSNGNNSNAIQGGANDTGETSGDGYAAQQGSSAGSGLVGALGGYSSTSHTTVAGRPDNTQLVGSSVQSTGSTVGAQKPTDGALSGAIHAGGAPGTTAYIARGATVNAGHDVQVRAKDRLEFSQTAGAVSAGFVGIGGSVTVGNIHANTTAYIAGTTVAGNNVAIESRLDETYDGLTFSGQGGFVGLGASVAVVSDDSQVRAYIDNSVSITKGDDVSVAAARTAGFSTTTAQVDVGAVAAGASYTDVTVGGRSAATIGDGVIITQSASSGLLHDTSVTAGSTISIDATAYGITSGIIAGQVNYARATINPTVVASVGNYSHLTSAGNVTVQASSNDVATSDLFGVAAGGIGVSVSLSRAVIAPNVSASLGVGSTIDAGGNVAIRAQEGQSGGTNARANSIAGSGGLFGGTGADAKATANVPVTASTAVNTRVTAGGNVTIEALANNAASASTTGLTIGGVSLGLSISEAQSSGATRARTDGNITAGGNVSVNARATNVVDAAATALAGASSVARTEPLQSPPLHRPSMRISVQAGISSPAAASTYSGRPAIEPPPTPSAWRCREGFLPGLRLPLQRPART